MNTPALTRAQMQAAPVIARLRSSIDVASADAMALEQLLARRSDVLDPGVYVQKEGEAAGSIIFLLQGWMLVYKSLGDGRRQIIRILLPGDFFGIHWRHVGRTLGSVVAVTSGTCATVNDIEFERLCASRPELARAVDRSLALSVAVQNEWMLGLGRRTALERVSYLICEVYDRLESIGLASGSRCEFPMTQTDLADATGLSIVHVNRVLQELRTRGLITLRHRVVQIHQMLELTDLASYVSLWKLRQRD